MTRRSVVDAWRSRRWTTSAALIAAGVVSGLVAYAFVIIGVRSFGAETFAPIAIVWSLWAIAAAGLSTPLQHWIIQTARVTGSEVEVRRRRTRLACSSAGLALGTVGLAWFARDPLYGTEEMLYPLVTGAVVVSATLAGYVRGVLGARDRFGALAASLAGEGALRLVLLLVAVAAGWPVGAAAVAVPCATLVVLGWTSTFRLTTVAQESAHHAPRLGSLALAFLLLHLVMNAPPVVATLLGAAPTVVSSLFAAFALFRAPFLVLSIVATKISYEMATLAARGRADTLTRLRNWVAASTVGGMALGAVLGMAPARFAVKLVYGPGVALQPLEGPSIVAGSIAGLGALVLVLLLAARGRASAALWPLVTGIVSGAFWFLLSPMAPGPRVTVGFLIGQSCIVVALVVSDRRLAAGRSTDDQLGATTTVERDEA